MEKIIEYNGRKYKQGKHIPQSELKEGMVVICGDEARTASSCWRAPDPKLPNKGIVLAPFVLVACEGNKGIEGLKRIPVGMTGIYDLNCNCDDRDHLYEAIEITVPPLPYDFISDSFPVGGASTPHYLVTASGMPTNSNQTNSFQPTLMSTIKTVLKNLTLSATDKTLRAHDLENEHGEMAEQAKVLMCEEMQEARWATRRVEIATALKAEDDAKK